MKFRSVISAIVALATLMLGIGAATQAVSAQSGTTRMVPVAGTTQPQTGEYIPSGSNDATQAEFPGQLDEENGPGPYPGTIVNRSLSNGSGNGVSVNSGKKAKSHPDFNNGFEGLNIYQQRYARGGNQFTV
jgi:hypothetical protein